MGCIFLVSSSLGQTWGLAHLEGSYDIEKQEKQGEAKCNIFKSRIPLWNRILRRQKMLVLLTFLRYGFLNVFLWVTLFEGLHYVLTDETSSSVFRIMAPTKVKRGWSIPRPDEKIKFYAINICDFQKCPNNSQFPFSLSFILAI